MRVARPEKCLYKGNDTVLYICSYDEPDLEYDYEDLVTESPTDLDGLGAHGGVPAQGPPGAHGYDRYVGFTCSFISTA